MPDVKRVWQGFECVKDSQDFPGKTLGRSVGQDVSHRISRTDHRWERSGADNC